MQESAVNEVLQEVRSLRRELHELNGRLDQWKETVSTLERKKQNTARRRQYAAAKRQRQKGLLSLPEHPILTYRDKRLRAKFVQWAQVGMRFGAADQPAAFCTWLVHQWNNCTYIKKPVTFSGSSFRIWNGCTRYAYGSRDLLNFSERKPSIGVLRNLAEHQDFCARPWWDWNWAVYRQVFNEMDSIGLSETPERFQRLVRIMAGGFGSYEVYSDLFWDFNESFENINKMFRRIGTDLQIMLRAVHTGLRIKGLQSPIPIPGEDVSPQPQDC